MSDILRSVMAWSFTQAGFGVIVAGLLELQPGNLDTLYSLRRNGTDLETFLLMQVNFQGGFDSDQRARRSLRASLIQSMLIMGKSVDRVGGPLGAANDFTNTRGPRKSRRNLGGVDTRMPTKEGTHY